MNNFFCLPRLRKGVAITVIDSGISLHYHEQGCDITVETQAKNSLLAFLKTLAKGKYNILQLIEKFPEEESFSCNDVIKHLDQLGLIDDGMQTQPSGALSGDDFYYSRLIPVIRKWQYNAGDSPFYSRMLSGKITNNEIIGFAMEYYHLVHMSPAIIAPALSHNVNNPIRSRLLNLFVEEYDHDKMLIACLDTVGIDESVLSARQPLPATFMANASLGVYARQHLLSFICALLLFETPSHIFNEAFINACIKNGLPENFYTPIIKHSDINEEGEHGLITLNLLKEIPVISAEEQNVILVHICSLIEMLNEEDRQIVDFYSQKNDLRRVYNY
ncbi:iron-containing redox enzyme family protein [Sodalis sp. RH23]|uniref:iron-containing redox enzyme family protein n=1 Tax=unclassified Sodalis (in: enterobacteria) TaxID=2636512 RepID=UPI0039B48987